MYGRKRKSFKRGRRSVKRSRGRGRGAKRYSTYTVSRGGIRL